MATRSSQRFPTRSFTFVGLAGGCKVEATAVVVTVAVILVDVLVKEGATVTTAPGVAVCMGLGAAGFIGRGVGNKVGVAGGAVRQVLLRAYSSTKSASVL